MNTLKNPKDLSVNGRNPRKTLKSPQEEKRVSLSLENPVHEFEESKTRIEQQASDEIKIVQSKETASNIKTLNQTRLSYAEQQKQNKWEKSVVKDRQILSGETWSIKKEHTLTYIGVFLFTFFVYFRPYDLSPALSGLDSLAFALGIGTILIYLTSQLRTGKLMPVFSTEVKCILFVFFWAILTMPFALNPEISWFLFNARFEKIVLIFVIMTQTLQTKLRLKGLMWLSLGAGIMVSYQALEFYRQGVFKTEGYRVKVDYEGMFGNPNDAALHMVLFTPIAIALGIASKNKLAKLAYFASAGLMIAGNLVTQSRGGGLGLIAVSVFLVWRLSKENRFTVMAISLAVGLLIIMFAPGNYGLRMLSIFVPGLDPVGSSEQRSDLLIQSIIVTLRHPLGIGFGNFPIVGLRNRETHNAYTQVSSELGWLSAAAYLIFIISPLRKLGAIERRMAADKNYSWIYYLSIGIQASIIGYMVSSFFLPVAYTWFVYYPIAYAIGLRRIYQIEGLNFNQSRQRHVYKVS